MSWAATSTWSRCCSWCSRSASALGSLLCERLSGHKVEIGLVPFGSIGLTLFALDLWLATRDDAAALAGMRIPGRPRTGASSPTSC